MAERNQIRCPFGRLNARNPGNDQRIRLSDWMRATPERPGSSHKGMSGGRCVFVTPLEPDIDHAGWPEIVEMSKFVHFVRMEIKSLRHSRGDRIGHQKNVRASQRRDIA